MIKSASIVLASLRDSTYRSVRLASSLAAALLDSLSEQPAGHSVFVNDLNRGVVSDVAIQFLNKLPVHMWGGYRVTRPLIVLGSGYTGLVLHRMGTLQGRNVHATSRNPLNNLAAIPPEQRLQFDLEQPSTWGNIPAGADLIWCFPATPLEQVQAFARMLVTPTRRMVVLGSTSAYDTPSQSIVYPPPWIDESAPLDLSKQRVQGEEYLREHHGAIVLRVAGIYGPGRNPLDWVRSGRVSPSRKYVNLIHAEDLAAICLLALDKGKPGETYNVSDGTARTWDEIYATAQQLWGVPTAAKKEDRSTGKRISTAKLRTELGYGLKHPDLYEALAMIESSDKV